MKFEETAIIFNKIKQRSSLNDEALELLGITKDKIDTAMHQCTTAGMSRKKAMHVIFKMWINAQPKDKTK